MTTTLTSAQAPPLDLREMVIERARDKVRQVLRWGGENGAARRIVQGAMARTLLGQEDLHSIMD